MPEIKIREQDLSWYYRQRQPGQLVVLVPGVASFGPHTPTVVTDKNFTKTYGTSAVDPQDLSYVMASSYIKSGIDVLFWRVPLSGEAVASYKYKDKENTTDTIQVLAKYSGKYGNSLSVKAITHGSNYRFLVYDTSNSLVETLVVNFTNPDSEYYYETVNNTSLFIEFKLLDESKLTDLVLKGTNKLVGGADGTYTKDAVTTYLEGEDSDTVFSDLADKLSYNFNIITSGGYNKYENEDASQIKNISKIDDKFIHLAETRGTAIYLVDGDKSWTAEEFYSYTALPTAEEENDHSDLKSVSGFNTSYAVAFGPWCSAQLTSSGVTRVLPGSYVFLISWAQSLANGTPMYFAPAGVKRSQVNFVKSTEYPIGSAVLQLWQNQDSIESDGHKLNPIMNLRQYGYVIYGNSTLLQNKSDGATSMLQSLSTRILANLIKSRAFDISLSLQFDQTSDDLFAEFKTLMTVFMEQLRYNEALYDYRIIADRSILTLDDLNSKTVPIKIQISPTPAAENFVIDLEIAQAGTVFGEESTSDTQEG